MAKIITSPNNEIIKTTYKLLRDSKSHCIAIENTNLITLEFCQLNDLLAIYCTQSWYDANQHIYTAYDKIIIITTNEIISKLGFTQTAQDVLATIKYKYNHFEPKPNGKYFVLDNINDPGNLGTILRNAVAFNFDEIFINQNGVSPLNEKVVRSSMGALLSTKINFYQDLTTLVDQLKQLEINVFATALDISAKPLQTLETTKNYAIILGNEAHGIDKKHLAYIGSNLYIPISGIDSLNVASASAIIMYHLNSIGSK